MCNTDGGGASLNLKSLYLMFLSSKNLFRHLWMMWSAKSTSRIRFSDCLSFSKDLTSGHTTTLTRAAGATRDRSGVLQPAQDSNACGTADAAGAGGLVYLHVVPLLVRDEGHAVDPGQPAVLQQSLLGLNTTKGDGGSVVNQLNQSIWLFHQLHPAVP